MITVTALVAAPVGMVATFWTTWLTVDRFDLANSNYYAAGGPIIFLVLTPLLGGLLCAIGVYRGLYKLYPLHDFDDEQDSVDS